MKKNITTETPYASHNYSFYSNVLNTPFASLDELNKAEEVYFNEQKAKADKAATKKADAKKVEDSFKALNQARRDYKENLLKLTDIYQKDLKELKANFENDKARIQGALADAENDYASELKVFTDKYAEGYHLTLRDGDFETTICGNTTNNSHIDAENLFDWLFRW